MDAHLLNTISCQAEANQALIKALQEASEKIEDLKNALEYAKNPDACSAVAANTISRCDPVVIQHPEDHCPYPEDLTIVEAFLAMSVCIDKLSETDAYNVDIKWRLRYLYKLIQADHVNVMRRADDTEELLRYQKGETDLYKGRWQELSVRVKELNELFSDEDDLTDPQRIAFGNALKACE